MIAVVNAYSRFPINQGNHHVRIFPAGPSDLGWNSPREPLLLLGEHIAVSRHRPPRLRTVWELPIVRLRLER